MTHIKIIAEIGINHNGDLNLAKKLIDIASISGCNYVKFQKRNPDVSVPQNQKDIEKETPWGKLKYIDYKKKIEFNLKQYSEIDNYCKEKKIKWFASVWDLDSVDFLSKFTNMVKIPSAKLTNEELCKYSCNKFSDKIISTGMSEEKEIIKSINWFKPNIIMHTLSTYPSPIEELNLNYIQFLKEKYKNCEIGYSGHEYGLATTYAAVALGATWIERHITLDRTLWGSDQMASLEPIGLMKLVKGIRDIELSLGKKIARTIQRSELSKKKSLRGN